MENDVDLFETEETIPEQTEVKEPKKKKAKSAKKRSSQDRVTITLLSGILVVGICLLCVSIIGMMGALNTAPVVAEQTTVAPDVQQNQNNAPDVNVNNQTPVTPQETTTSTGEGTQNTPSGATAPSSNEEWLTFFNTAVNKLKTDAPGMVKAKQTKTIDIQLSNPLGNTVVEAQKDKYLSDEIVKTEIAKGDKAAAQTNVSPDGAAYVSTLTLADIKSISGSTDSNGNYVISISMNDCVNPDLSSSYAKIFEFMLVDDVMNTYAPDIGATVDRNNVELKYSNCSLTATITPDGKVVTYKTTVNANMILKDAKVKVIKTDLDATLLSETNYTNIVW